MPSRPPSAAEGLAEVVDFEEAHGLTPSPLLGEGLG
jgi:hypothetical protein